MIKFIENKHYIIINNEEIKLTQKEFDILELLYNNKNNIVTLKNMLECINNYPIESDLFSLRVHISNLRKKLDKKSDVITIKTITKTGYILCI